MTLGCGLSPLLPNRGKNSFAVESCCLAFSVVGEMPPNKQPALLNLTSEAAVQRSSCCFSNNKQRGSIRACTCQAPRTRIFCTFSPLRRVQRVDIPSPSRRPANIMESLDSLRIFPSPDLSACTFAIMQNNEVVSFLRIS
jgi:hypothetical protein